MKLGGPCPYSPQPALCCRLEKVFPGFEIGVFATVICRGCCFDIPFESVTEIAKPKAPAVLGVPEKVPLFALSATLVGSWPEASEKR